MMNYEIVGHNNKINLNTLKLPLYIYIELTATCNLKCKFCSVDNKCTNFISVRTIKRILNELKEGSYAVSQLKENKKDKNTMQVDLFNYKLGEIAHEIDKINLNELTPIDALNTLLKIKEKMK